MDCLFCNNEFEEASIKDYDNWSLQLFVDDQYYIGRSVVVLKGRHAVDINDLTKTERSELFEKVLPDIRSSLNEVFSPDLYNYCSLGNDCRHFHLHIIPRYEEERYFNGKKFEDEFWNETYSQDYNRVKLDEDEFEELKNTLEKNL